MAIKIPNVSETQLICGCIKWKFGNSMEGTQECWVHEIVYRACEED